MARGRHGRHGGARRAEARHPRRARRRPGEADWTAPSTRPARRRPATATHARAVLGGYTYGDLSRTPTTPAGGPHNGGEVWAETLWDLRTAVGRDAALKLIAGGMRLTPDDPSMLDARDAILRQAIAMRSAPGAPDDYFAEAWEVFQARGMGFDATTASAASTTPDRELHRAAQRALRRADDGHATPTRAATTTARSSRASWSPSRPRSAPRGLTDMPGVTGSLTSTDPGRDDRRRLRDLAAAGQRADGAQRDPLTARLPDSCDTNIPLKVDVTVGRRAVPATATVRMRPWARNALAIADAPDAADRRRHRGHVRGPGGRQRHRRRRAHRRPAPHVPRRPHRSRSRTPARPPCCSTAPPTGPADDIVDAIFDSDSATATTNAGARSGDRAPCARRSRPG